jgi:hypothetical protein
MAYGHSAMYVCSNKTKKQSTMKKHYLLSLLLASVVFLFAEDVSQKDAETVAKNFYSLTTDRPVYGFTLATQVTTNTQVGRPSDGKPVYYVFNINNEGFVIISGDDLVQPVLGYSTEGTFNPQNINQAVSKWLNGYEKQIVYVKENVHQTTDEITRDWNNYLNGVAPQGADRGTNAVNPLCATKWNQSPYENGQCPFDNQYNERTVTGCVATAMAQIMKFWNYPTQGTGFHSYNEQSYGTQSANFASTTYNWAQMPNILNSANGSVATIMYHCGVSVDMDYGVGATGGSAAYVVSSLSPVQACSEYSYKTYFGYDPATVQGVARSNYSETNWINLMKNELDNSRPLQYAGMGSGGGHTWVCDGYDNNNFFHMNWGWAGNSDGYFSLNSLDPTSLGAGGGTGGFNNTQQAVIGIKPLTGGGGGGGGGGTVNQDGIALYAQTTVSANPVQANTSFTVTATIANNGTTNFTGDFAAAIFNSNGVFVDFIQEFTNQTAQAGYYYTVPFTIANLDVVPGTYVVGIFYKNGSNNYSLVNQATFTNPVSITVTGPTNAIQMYSNSTVAPGTPQVNQAFNVSTQIANTGGTNFSGWLSADLFDMNGDWVTTIEEKSGVNMQAGYYYNLQFATTGLNVDPGTYYIAYFSSTNGSNWTLVYGGQNMPNPIEVTIVGQSLSPDQYENNNTSPSAAVLNVNFSGNVASVNTTGSNTHLGNDYDYYKINLPSGTNYAITARVHDSYNSGNGNNYTNDVQFTYVANGGAASSTYDDVMPGSIVVQNGGTVVFFVSDYFSGTTGTYLLDLQITRGQSVGVKETEVKQVNVFPNPADNFVWIDAAEIEGNYTLEVFNQVGQKVLENKGETNGNLIQTDVTSLPSGIYNLQLTAGGNIAKGKIVKAQ